MPDATSTHLTDLTHLTMTDVHRSKLPPDHPGLRLDRPQPRTLRKGPVIAIASILAAVVLLSIGFAMTPTKPEADRRPVAQTDTRRRQEVTVPDAIKKRDPAPDPSVPKLGPPLRQAGASSSSTTSSSTVAVASHSTVEMPDAPPLELGPVSPPPVPRRQLFLEERDRVRSSPLFFNVEDPTQQPPPANGHSASAPPPSTTPSVDQIAALARAGAQQATQTQGDANLQDHKNQFLARSGRDEAAYLKQLPAAPRSPYEIKAGTIIPASLITGLDSDLPGTIVGQVRESVYDTVTGQHLLIPQGSRLIAAYDSMVSFGQERVLVCWNRLIRPDGVSLALDCMPGVDLAGYAGFATQQLTQKDLQLRPRIKVRPGFSVNVLVSKDMILPPYRAQ